MTARVEEWWQHAWDRANAIWHVEVFNAEDTIEVDGKKITGHRSVTVGKIVTALIILTIGYWLCLYLAAQIGRLAVKRLAMAPEVANLLRQWSQALLLTHPDRDQPRLGQDSLDHFRLFGRRICHRGGIRRSKLIEKCHQRHPPAD